MVALVLCSLVSHGLPFCGSSLFVHPTHAQRRLVTDLYLLIRLVTCYLQQFPRQTCVHVPSVCVCVCVCVFGSNCIGLQDTICLCTLGPGCSLGFTSASSNAHSITVVTQEPCTLLRVNRRTFEEIWKDECRSSQGQPVTRINGEIGNCIDPSSAAASSSSSSNATTTAAVTRSFARSPDLPSTSTIPSLNVVKDTKVSHSFYGQLIFILQPMAIKARGSKVSTTKKYWTHTIAAPFCVALFI